MHHETILKQVWSIPSQRGALYVQHDHGKTEASHVDVSISLNEQHSQAGSVGVKHGKVVIVGLKHIQIATGNYCFEKDVVGRDDEQWNDGHRAFLQAFMARSTMTLEEAKPLLAAILTAYERKETLPEDITEADFNSYIAAANTRISPFDLEIRSTFHQTTRTRLYALVNSTSDPIIQLATTHTAEEISFLKRVLDAMFETYNTSRHEVMAITSMQAIRLSKPRDTETGTPNGADTQGNAGQGLKMAEAEKMLKTLVDEGWFEKSRKGFYSLSPRALMELRGWLIETYNDVDEDEDEEDRAPRIKQCVACKEIVTMMSAEQLYLPTP
ncbi:MAG: hypothetical protein Q9208_001476 [Pyrenodesmia sp. 3 TL-2023]